MSRSRITRRPTRHRLLAATAVAALLLAGCSDASDDSGSSTDDQSDQSDSSEAAQSGELPSAPPVDPITWKDCTQDIAEATPEVAKLPVEFECGTVEVPADYAEPDDVSLGIVALKVVPQAEGRRPVGSLVVNPGGPGESGLDFAVSLLLSAPAELLASYDIVGFDPRGVGLSTPLDCISDEQQDAQAEADPTPDEETFAAEADLAEQIGQACAEASDVDLGLFNTDYTARDMDRLREAIGEEKLTYFGASYGTTLGSTYAELFPEKVGAMVLDGATDPTLDRIDSSLAQAQGFETAFDRFAAACKQSGPKTCPAGPDARTLVDQLREAASQQPIPQRQAREGDTRSAGEGVVLSAVLSSLYSEASWPALGKALAAAAGGDSTALFQISDAFSKRQPDGTYASNASEMNTAVNCADTDEELDSDRVYALSQDWAEEAPMFGSFAALSNLLQCANWDADRHPVPERDGSGAPPILVVGTIGDPATPYSGAESMARTLESGSLLTYEGDGHVASFGDKSPCIDKAVTAYLVDGTVPADGTTCPA